MKMIRWALLVVILLAAAVMLVAWYRRRRAIPEQGRVPPGSLALGFAVEFGDTLGIGSFAPTTAVLKLFKLVPDELIPGTLIVGTMIGVVAEAVIFIDSVDVQPALLVSMIALATAGAWFGAGIVARMSRRKIQLAMGSALLVAGAVFAAKNLAWLPADGAALALEGWRFVVADLAALVLGALMTVGIGMYAPTMIVLSLLGMHTLAAFPIMMGACALLQAVGGLKFIETGRFAHRTALGLSLSGVFGVLLAAYVVKSLPLEALRWLVVIVVAYAAALMLRSALARPVPAAAAVSPPP
jgi:uncharacterized membrane protein YfcA